MSAPNRLIDSKAWCPLSFLLEIVSTIMGIQDKNMKNSIKLNNYLKSKTMSKLKKLDIDWYIVIKPSVPCSGRKSISEKMSLDSIQN